MANPLTAAKFELLARAARIAFVPYDGWTTRNRGQRGDGWGKTEKNPTGVHGLMWHHTVTGDVPGTIRIAKDTGQSAAVPAPLYSGLVDPLGRLHMIAWGRCNHAGLGDPDALASVIREDGKFPKPNTATVDGNARFYGFAFINWGNGTDPYTKEALATAEKVSEVFLRAHGWNQNSLAGHRNWQPGKIDPWGPQGDVMIQLRKGVGARLRKK